MIGLFRYLKEYKKYAILTPIMVIFEVTFEVLIPYVIGIMVDKGLKAANTKLVYMLGGAMVVLALLSLLCGVLAGKYASLAATGMAKNLRQEVFDKIQDFSFANVDKYSTASLVTRITTDINNAQMSFQMIIRMLIRSPLYMIFSIVMSVIVKPELSIIFILAIPVLGIPIALIASKVYPRFLKLMTRYDQMNRSVQENLIGIRTVKSFVRENYENKKFRESSEDVSRAQIFAEKLLSFNMPLMNFVMYATTLALVWFGGNLIIRHDMTDGQLTSYLSYVTQMLMSLVMISMVLVNIVLSKASIERIFAVIHETPDIRDRGNGEDIPVQDGSIEFRNVYFKYKNSSTNYILNNVSLQIRSGETIGIIGGTGSAKSTLVQLIPRLYDVSEGTILVGGNNVKEYKIHTLRDAVSMVLQKNVLFSGTIRDNLRWGNENATDEEIMIACKTACAHDFIMGFPKGYDTVLEQGGVNLSGGQKQRLCIARALLKNPKIIILDDSTSAVDTATDAKIRKAFKENFRNITALIIAQRISSVQDADRILVLDEGRIAGFGTHEELLKSNQIYREVYESQKKGAE